MSSGPTPVHSVGEVQDTPPNPVAMADRTGTCWIVQLAPFHLSAIGSSFVFPTAVHAVGEVHDTP
jgi:hypothetical protein